MLSGTRDARSLHIPKDYTTSSPSPAAWPPTRSDAVNRLVGPSNVGRPTTLTLLDPRYGRLAAGASRADPWLASSSKASEHWADVLNRWRPAAGAPSG